ncbi:MAG: hypothetical protein RIA69_21045 [Cyclobacteriaceae bacterium]
MLKIKTLIIFSFFVSRLFGQCDQTKNWGAIGYPDPDTGLEMFLPMTFEFTSDSIFIKNSQKPDDAVKYLITNSECDWDKEYLTGEAVYEILIIASNKTATLNLKSEVGKGTIHILMDDPNFYSPKFKVKKMSTE